MAYSGYVGTYTSDLSKGIYSFNYRNHKIEDVKLFAEVKNPKYLCFLNEYIVAVCDFEDGSGISVFDKEGHVIDTLRYEDSTSCYITSKNNFLYTVNYHEGTFSVVKFEDEKLTLIKKVLIKPKAGCHQVLFYKDKILVFCLFLDKIVIFNESFEIEGYIEFEKGSGIRHGVFSKDGRYLYVVGELSNLLYVTDMEELRVCGKYFILENRQSYLKGSAAIRMHDDKIYISTRGEDVISVVRVWDDQVVLKAVFSTCGNHPRDFVVIEDCLLVANRYSNNLVLFNKNYEKIDEVMIPEGISIIVKEKS